MATDSISLFESTDETSQPYVVGKVATTFFESPDSFYKVLLVSVTETNLEWQEPEIVVTGSFADIADEAAYRFFGRLVEHPKYGQQFQATNYQNETPTSKSGLISYLSSDEFPGIGQKTAERVVEALGTTTIDKINANPAVLNPLGLSAKVKDTLVTTLAANNGVEQIIIGLNGYGFGSQLASAIFEKYKEKTLPVIQENPYQLVEDISGVSFKRADQIAAQLGIEFDSPKRIQAGILQALNELAMAEGNTYTTARPLLTRTISLLQESRQQEVAPQLIADELLELGRQQKVVGEDDRIFLKSLFDTEWQIAEHLNRLLHADFTDDFNDEAIQKQLRVVEKHQGITYDDSQNDAIKAAIQSPLFLLTGGPGTGKTTIINGIVNLYARLHEISLDINQYKDKPFPILLAAPTGRAAKRMSETTGLPASTIHRLLGLTGRESTTDVNAAKDLEGAILIIDEMSMVDVYLFKTLLRAIPDGMRVILVGDKDQLPSVGPGQVFFDLLASHRVPAIELDTIYRQSGASSIIPLAHEIKNGRLPADFEKNQTDRSFIACQAYQMPSVVEQIISRAMAKGFTADDIQVLAPMYRGPAGVTNLNTIIQDIMNPKTENHKKEVEFRGETFRIGDKVLHLVNSPENNVFNGDIGRITGIAYAKDKGNTDRADKLTIVFDQNEVTYGRNDWSRLTLAYCTTIHKAQGSQFKMVILPMVMQYARMLQRNLLYTAVTRAKKTLIMLGDSQAFQRSVENESVNRLTVLKERMTKTISESVEPVTTADQASKEASANVGSGATEPVGTEPPSVENSPESSQATGPLTPTLLASGKIDPMIGMQGITPKSFMPSRE
ncbi:ATP-dependent RecD-like DNA helicase [uncultured Secundilactobacillus sp.]|uniref:SF1B family DNA helicase RecD2 n=1 Tax=uncultured Secundilactobacillus sp. TaxID=2813935 RepID=UPI002583B604|nr:ATP-dependent RecD-like DNA helicase [uncultured Secundilactobacillus sp.]